MERHGLLAISCFLLVSGCGAQPEEKTGVLGQALGGPTVASVSLSPSKISGGSGAFSTGTVTLSAPAPNGGTSVALSSSIPQLAVSQLSVVVAAGATSASFSIATNPGYRDYSGLAFSPVFTASANGGSQSATLSVSAQALGPDINNDSLDRHGTVCGGNFPATTGERGILYNCTTGNPIGIPGPCTFVQECSVGGCLSMPPSGVAFSDQCNGSPPYPLSFGPVQGGDSTTGTIALSSKSSGDTAALANASCDATMPSSVSIPNGATTATFSVSTMAVANNEFDRVGLNVALSQGGSPNNPIALQALQWLPIVVTPAGPGPVPAPAVTSIVMNIDPVVGGQNSTCTVTLASNAPSSGATITMTSSNPSVASVPSSVTVGGSGSCADNVAVVITTSQVAAQTVVTITASDSGGSQSATLTVDPCVPATCAAQGYKCGTAPDGCGGTLDCGSCPVGKQCAPTQGCVSCTRETCSGLGFNCGTASDGCGGTLSCGKCAKGRKCVSNVCK